jgi:c-di-GMP-binding flagellar brake protein YcgR
MALDGKSMEDRDTAAADDSLQRRKYVRYAVALPCRLIGERGAEQATIIDLSFGGCKVHTDRLMLSGEYLRLAVYSVVRSRPLSVDLAVVRWVGPTVAGLEFIRMESVQQERLRLLLRYIEKDHGLGIAGETKQGGPEP